MCAAPAGNQFWKLRSKHGRDYLFASSEALWDAAAEYFNWVDAHPWFKVEQLKKPYLEKATGPGGKDKWVTVTKVPTARPYTIQGLCIYLGCNSVWFNQFENALDGRDDDLSKDFSQILLRVREIIYTQKFEGAAVGAFNASIIARDLGLADKKESRQVDKDGNDIPQSPQIMVIAPGTKEYDEFEIKEAEE